MSNDGQSLKPETGAEILERRSDPEANPTSGKRSKQSSASLIVTRPWARASEHYDWMDAHTPCADLNA